MTDEEVIQSFKQAGALLEGHFLFASGRHGSQFLQAARVLQYPNLTEQLCKGLAEKYLEDDIQLVVGPATGGIILAYETARHLNCRGAFTEKDGAGGMELKRGFRLEAGTRVLVVEDIVTTGGSVHKSVSHLEGRGAIIAGVAVLIDRSGGQASFGCAYRPLARLEMTSWQPSECPLCQARRPLVDPDDIVLE